MWKKQFAASSANLGPGFDSFGIALNRFLTIEAQESEEWVVHFKTPFLSHLPKDDKNMVLNIAKRVARRYHKTLPTLSITMESEIPLTHGMGSSASAIVAAVELANDFANLNLSLTQRIKLASEIEGHPDNVGACYTGGVFIGYHEGTTFYFQTTQLKEVAFVITTPAYELATKKARSVLPTQYEKSDSIAQNALSSVMIMAMMKRDYKMMGQLMMKDKFHEPYRQPLIAEFPEVKRIALEHGAYATVISGAGPSILTMCPLNNVDNILNALKENVDCEHQQVEIYQKTSF